MMPTITNEYKEACELTGEKLINHYPYNLIFYVYTSLDPNSVFDVYVPGFLSQLETLTEREQKVIEYHFRDKMTLEETGKMIGVGKERARQIQAKAARKLKAPIRSKNWLFDLKRRYIESEKELSKYKLKYITISDELERIGHAELIEEKDPYDIPICELDLSVRSYNCLVRKNIKTIRDIAALTESQLMNFRNLGRKSFNEIVSKLNEYGLELKKEEG